MTPGPIILCNLQGPPGFNRSHAMSLPHPFARAATTAAALLLSALPTLRGQGNSTPSGGGTAVSQAATSNAPTTQSIGGTVTSDTTGPIAVFRLTFQATGDSINYRSYDGGFYVAPVEGGVGTLILTLSSGGQKRYFTYASFGAVFIAVKGSTKKMVLSCTAASDVSTTVFYALGNADTEIEFDTRNANGSVLVADKMTGYAVSADSEQDLPYAGSTTNVGVAGASVLTARLDKSLTSTGNKKGNAVNDEIADLQAILIKGGYTDGKNTTATGQPVQTTGTGGNTNG